jgi:hypothetical protein
VIDQTREISFSTPEPARKKRAKKKEEAGPTLRTNPPRNVRAGDCGRCGARVVRGWDEDVMAWWSVADVTPVTVEEEREVLKQYPHAESFDLIRRGEGWAMYRRDQFHRTTSGIGYPILMGHRCGGG